MKQQLKGITMWVAEILYDLNHKEMRRFQTKTQAKDWVAMKWKYCGEWSDSKTASQYQLPASDELRPNNLALGNVVSADEVNW